MEIFDIGGMMILGVFPLKMVIFHSYVSLPEGNPYIYIYDHLPKIVDRIRIYQQNQEKTFWQTVIYVYDAYILHETSPARLPVIFGSVLQCLGE